MTTTLTVPGTAPPAAFGQLVRNEVRLAWRQPTSLIGGLALPAALLIIFSFIPTFRQPQASLGGFSPLDLYVPILIGFSLAMLALFGLPIPLVTYRELGVLRRLSTTPVPPRKSAPKTATPSQSSHRVRRHQEKPVRSPHRDRQWHAAAGFSPHPMVPRWRGIPRQLPQTSARVTP